jgi:cytidylate kinase
MASHAHLVNRQILRWSEEQRALRIGGGREATARLRPVVTISRQVGSGGSMLAEILSRRLGYALFDRELIHAMAEQAGIQDEIIQEIEENRANAVDLWVEGVIRGRQFDRNDYMHTLVRAVYLIAHRGAAVIVGRGANFILDGEPAFRVRVVESLPERRMRLMREQDLAASDADEILHRCDHDAAEFIHKNFGRDIDDSTAYHLVLNTGTIPPETGVEMIEAALARLEWAREPRSLPPAAPVQPKS